jgi:eukaryotic-like serine/threonine-protein kinase
MSEDLAALSRKFGDRYLIERELGRGGMGAVYLARDRRLDRPVALKVLPQEYAIVPELRERFLRETRLAAGFSHPNIVPVFAIEESDEILAFAMGFVEGESVAARVAREGPLSRRDAVRLLQDVSYALAYAHGRGVVHRDIKPDNIMIERATGRALVMDFGIARAITPVSDKPGLTRVGEVVGTPEYMSPEQASGDAVDGRSDLYSLGLVAWFGMTGRTAVTGESTQRVLVKQLTEPIPSLAAIRSDLPAALCEVVDRCCAKEADDRFVNAEAVVEALDATQLATPDLPVAIRLLAPALSSVVVRTTIAFAMLAFGAYGIVRDGNGNILALGLIATAAAWVAGATAVQDVRRLRRAGFTTGELQRVLRLVFTERDDERARRVADEGLVIKRRRRVRIASALLVSQVTFLVSVIRRATSSGAGRIDSLPLMLAFFGALLGSAMAILVLFGSPFKRPMGERVFRAIWLSPVGLRLMALMAGSAHTPSVRSPSQSAPVPAATQRVPNSAPLVDAANRTSPTMQSLADDIHVLRARVDALEAHR